MASQGRRGGSWNWVSETLITARAGCLWDLDMQEAWHLLNGDQQGVYSTDLEYRLKEQRLRRLDGPSLTHWSLLRETVRAGKPGSQRAGHNLTAKPQHGSAQQGCGGPSVQAETTRRWAGTDARSLLRRRRPRGIYAQRSAL